MDDEAAKLLREIREILLRNEARDTAYMEENRRAYNEANAKNLAFARKAHIANAILLAGLVFAAAATAFALLRKAGVA